MPDIRKARATMRPFKLLLGLSCLITVVVHSQSNDVLTLQNTIDLALKNDQWLIENQYSQQAFTQQGVAENQAKEPRFIFDLVNVPVDTFDFNQEPMTQIRLGVSQKFERGQSLQLKKKKTQLESSLFPDQRLSRKRYLTNMITQLWLDNYLSQASIDLIEHNKTWFLQMISVVEAHYQNASLHTEQQDVLEAQLALTRLNDRLIQWQSKQQIGLQKLRQWVQPITIEGYGKFSQNSPYYDSVGQQLPNIKGSAFEGLDRVSDQAIYEQIKNHPLVLIAQKKIDSEELSIDIAKQQYKPEIAINASYGYRQTAFDGGQRPDFFSVGLSFDVPLFAKAKNSAGVKSAILSTELKRTEVHSLLIEMLSFIRSYSIALSNINKRLQLYKNKLLPQMTERVEASLNAYSYGSGDFADVLRSKVELFNTELDLLAIEVEQQKNKAMLNYYLDQE